jgi:hypothetical protein
MHPADVMGMAGDHAWTVGGDDPAQLGQRHRWPVIGYQAGRMQPAATVAAVAGDLQNRKTDGSLAKGDDADGHQCIVFAPRSLAAFACRSPQIVPSG